MHTYIHTHNNRHTRRRTYRPTYQDTDLHIKTIRYANKHENAHIQAIPRIHTNNHIQRGKSGEEGEEEEEKGEKGKKRKGAR